MSNDLVPVSSAAERMNAAHAETEAQPGVGYDPIAVGDKIADHLKRAGRPERSTQHQVATCRIGCEVL
jgi:hypothetical protein